MASSSSSYLLLSGLLLLFLLARPAQAFGAGNIASISRVEGQNWRHGDIEDTLLALFMARVAGGNKFSKLDVKRVYFGNWLRDYSQAVDVGTVKMVSAEAIRILLWILGFLSFGYGTNAFEVTTERLGCYRPEEHIDNPKDYADNIDARRYDPRLRGPVDERRELSVDPETGLKHYIASEHMGITTSAGLIRNVFGRCIELGRQYARSGNKSDLYEALTLLGKGLHCLEDFSAHSNYVELALIELGQRGVFPHVGRRAMVDVRGARQSVYPLVTGTFGGVDFLHSVMGEVSDKVTQSELDELEGTIQQSQSGQGNQSVLQELLSQLPSGLIGNNNQSGKMDELRQHSQAAQMQSMHITPRQPEEWTKQLQEVSKQIYPILEWHDGIMQSITETIEKVPILPQLLETFQEAINVFVFSLLAPYILPIIKQVKAELHTGSSEVIRSSRDKQLIVFHDDYSSDPTHSMLSKDHFSNVLNEPAGKVASQVLKWVVPQIMACWDDERIDVNRTLTRIINGVFHHPALRDYGADGAVDGRRQMFDVVEQWWESKNQREQRTLLDQLSREGVQNGRNHKEGVHDSGHGCGKPLGMPTYRTAASSGAIGGPTFGPAREGRGGRITGEQAAMGVGQLAGEAVGGGALGGIVGGVVGGVGAGLLSDSFQGDDDRKKKYSKQEYGRDGSYTQSYVEMGHHKKKHDDDEERSAQAEFRQTSFPEGGRRQEYQRYEQSGSGYGSDGHGYHQVQETRPSYGGGYERVTESKYERPGGEWESERRREGRSGDGQYYSETSHRTSHSPSRPSGYDYEKRHKKSESEDDDDDDDDKKKYKKDKEYKKQQKKEKEYKKEQKKEKKKKHHGEKSDDSDDDDDEPYKSRREGSPKYRGEDRKSDEPESRGYSGQQRYGGERREYESGGYGSSGYGYGQRERESGYEGGRSSSRGNTYDRGSGYEQRSSSYRKREESEKGRYEQQRGYARESSGYDQGDYGRRTGYEGEGERGGSGRYGEEYPREQEGYGKRNEYQEASGYGGREGYGRRDDYDESRVYVREEITDYGGRQEEEYGERRGYGGYREDY